LPKNQYDWPNPGVYVRPPWTHLDFTKQHLIGKDTFFGAPGQVQAYDYPNPQLPRRPDLTWIQKPLTASPTPFKQNDWPNPIGPVQNYDLRTFLNALELPLLGQDKFFGGPGQGPANLDWPVPKGPEVQ